jgi:hypothetical protein
MDGFVRGLSILLLTTCLVQVAEARRNYSYTYVSSSGNAPSQEDKDSEYDVEFKSGEVETMTRQAIAQLRADTMAAKQSMSHYIHQRDDVDVPRWPADCSEGIGCGNTPECATCVTGSTCVADASCKSENGMWYRVRFWQNKAKDE